MLYILVGRSACDKYVLIICIYGIKPMEHVVAKVLRCEEYIHNFTGNVTVIAMPKISSSFHEQFL